MFTLQHVDCVGIDMHVDIDTQTFSCAALPTHKLLVVRRVWSGTVGLLLKSSTHLRRLRDPMHSAARRASNFSQSLEAVAQVCLLYQNVHTGMSAYNERLFLYQQYIKALTSSRQIQLTVSSHFQEYCEIISGGRRYTELK